MGGRHKERTFAHLDEHFDFVEQSAARRAMEASWFASLSYYNGQQNLYLDERGNIVADEKPRYRANMLRVSTDMALAKVTSARIEMGVVPNSDDRRDRHGAMVGSRLYEHAKRVVSWDMLSLEALKWAAICGTAVYKTVWDPEMGPPERLYFADDDTELTIDRDDPARTQRAMRDAKYTEVRPGEVSLQVLSPFHFFVDTACRQPTLEGAEWVAHVQYMRAEKIAEIFGRKPKGSVGGETDEAEMFMRRLQHMIPDVQYAQLDSGSSTDENNRHCVIEYWRRPSSKRPQGRYVVCAGSDVLADRENPYARFGMPFPFVPQHWSISPGRFWGKGLVEDLRPIQREYNDARSHASRHQRLYSKPIIIAPKGSGLARAELRSLDGLLLTYRAAIGAPKSLEMPPLPEHVSRNAAIARGELMEISAQAPPESSSLPGQLRSGQAIGMMQRNNNLILTEPTKLFAVAAEGVGRNMLRLMSAMYEEPRVIATMGGELPLSVSSFSGADMNNNWDLRMFGEPTSIETSDAWKGDVLEMAQLGILNPQDPTDKEAIHKAFAFKTSEGVIADRIRFEALQEKQLDEMLRDPSFMPVPQPYEDNAAMAKVLVRMMLSPEFDRLDERARGRIRLLWEGRMQIVRQAMEAQMQAETMMAGTPGKTGTPSQPRRVAR